MNEHFQLSVGSVSINPFQHTVILGPNGSGKSALLGLIAGDGLLENGDVNVTNCIASVSVAQQQALIEAEKRKDCADILDIIPVPTTAKEILFEGLNLDSLNNDLLDELIAAFSLSKRLDAPFRALSSGETRKLLLTKALLTSPKLLILDEPLEGLDAQSCLAFNAILKKQANNITLLLVVNRLTEVPEFCQQILLMQEGQLHWQASVNGDLQNHLTHLRQLQHMQQAELAVPTKDSECYSPTFTETDKPLVKLSNVTVRYGDNIVFDSLNWTIQSNQHWQVTGPNGSGKTCLLNLITGDHPQCYVNDIFVFGYQRGNGESIWQIKQFIGYVSNAFHLDYKMNCSLLQVVLSGFYNSIGLYQQPTNNQVLLANEWLSLMALDKVKNKPFFDLSFGDQRMALIARAMVKHPALLILDEPCNGLDDINRIKVLALIDILAREGSTTVLYVNHHEEDAIPSIQNHLCMTEFNAKS